MAVHATAELEISDLIHVSEQIFVRSINIYFTKKSIYVLYIYIRVV